MTPAEQTNGFNTVVGLVAAACPCYDTAGRPVNNTGNLARFSVEIGHALDGGATPQDVANFIIGAWAGYARNKVLVNGQLVDSWELAWNRGTGEGFDGAITATFPAKSGLPGTPDAPAAPAAPVFVPDMGSGPTRDSVKVLEYLNEVPPRAPSGFQYCNLVDWNAHWKADVVAVLSKATAPGAYPGVDSGTVRLALTCEVFGYGTQLRGRGNKTYSGPFTATEIAGMTPGQLAEHIEPRGAGNAHVS